MLNLTLFPLKTMQILMYPALISETGLASKGLKLKFPAKITVFKFETNSTNFACQFRIYKNKPA
jgi:hypothetical protein